MMSGDLAIIFTYQDRCNCQFSACENSTPLILSRKATRSDNHGIYIPVVVIPEISVHFMIQRTFDHIIFMPDTRLIDFPVSLIVNWYSTKFIFQSWYTFVWKYNWFLFFNCIVVQSSPVDKCWYFVNVLTSNTQRDFFWNVFIQEYEKIDDETFNTRKNSIFKKILICILIN